VGIYERTLDDEVKRNETEAGGGSLIQQSISERPSPPWQVVFSIKSLSDTRGRVPPARPLLHSGLHYTSYVTVTVCLHGSMKAYD